MISIFLMFSNLKQKINAVIYHFIFNRETWLPRFAIDQNSCLFDWLRGEHPVKKQSSCLEYWMNMCWICNLSNILNLIIHIYRIFLCRKILKSVFIWYVRDMMNTKVAKLQILIHKTLYFAIRALFLDSFVKQEMDFCDLQDCLFLLNWF